MKQFKIIDLAPNIQTGIVTANFAMPIKIMPGSQISLDKFNITITDASGVYIPFNQVIGVQCLTTQPFLPVAIRGGFYINGISQFIIELNQAINSVFNGLNQQGLTFTASLVNNAISFHYTSVDFIYAVITPSNCATDTSGIFIYTGEPPDVAVGISLDHNSQGGGFIVRCDYRPDILGGRYLTSGFLYQADNTKTINIEQEPAIDGFSYGTMKIGSDLVPNITNIDLADFYPADVPTIRTILFTQENGFYVVSIYEQWVVGVIPVFITKYVTNIPWTISQANTFEFALSVVSGTSYVDLLTNPGYGNVYGTWINGYTDTAVLYTMTMDFSSAQQIKTGLGIVPALIVLAPINSVNGTYTNTVANPINFSLLRSNSLSLELLDIPIETYEAGSSVYPTPRAIPGVNNQYQNIRSPGSRKNVLCYFTPTLEESSSNTYRFFQSQYQWIDLANKLPLELTSLNFRVYFSDTNTPIICQSLSFNFLIKEQDPQSSFYK